jgi:hypothetical protein
MLKIQSDPYSFIVSVMNAQEFKEKYVTRLK